MTMKRQFLPNRFNTLRSTRSVSAQSQQAAAHMTESIDSVDFFESGMTASTSSSMLNFPCDKIFQDAFVTGVLNLNQRQLNEFPTESAQSSDVSDLVLADFSHNRMTELPMAVCEWRALETLQFRCNALKLVPPSISVLKSLSYLDLSENQISDLPDAIFTLPLKVLLLHRNRLQHISIELRQLSTTLQELDVSSNRLRALPAGISALVELSLLNVRDNQLKDIPSEIGTMNLRVLDLGDNMLIRLPWELCKLQCCTTLVVDGNPLMEPPLDVVRRGRTHIYKWLTSKYCAARHQSHNHFNEPSALTASYAPQQGLTCLSSQLDFSRANTLNATIRRLDRARCATFDELSAEGGGVAESAQRRRTADFAEKLSLDSGCRSMDSSSFLGSASEWSGTASAGDPGAVVDVALSPTKPSAASPCLDYRMALKPTSDCLQRNAEQRKTERRSRSTRLSGHCGPFSGTDSGYMSTCDEPQAQTEINLVSMSGLTISTKTLCYADDAEADKMTKERSHVGGDLAKEIMRTFENNELNHAHKLGQATSLMDLSNNNVPCRSNTNTIGWHRWEENEETRLNLLTDNGLSPVIEGSENCKNASRGAMSTSLTGTLTPAYMTNWKGTFESNAENLSSNQEAVLTGGTDRHRPTVTDLMHTRNRIRQKEAPILSAQNVELKDHVLSTQVKQRPTVQRTQTTPADFAAHHTPSSQPKSTTLAISSTATTMRASGDIVPSLPVTAVETQSASTESDVKNDVKSGIGIPSTELALSTEVESGNFVPERPVMNSATAKLTRFPKTPTVSQVKQHSQPSLNNSSAELVDGTSTSNSVSVEVLNKSVSSLNNAVNSSNQLSKKPKNSVSTVVGTKLSCTDLSMNKSDLVDGRKQTVTTETKVIDVAKAGNSCSKTMPTSSTQRVRQHVSSKTKSEAGVIVKSTGTAPDISTSKLTRPSAVKLGARTSSTPRTAKKETPKKATTASRGLIVKVQPIGQAKVIARPGAKLTLEPNNNHIDSNGNTDLCNINNAKNNKASFVKAQSDEPTDIPRLPRAIPVKNVASRLTKTRLTQSTLSLCKTPRPFTPQSATIDQMRKILQRAEFAERIEIQKEKLAAQLADGVLLCTLVNSLKPESIPTVGKAVVGSSTLAQSRARRNVENFVAACRSLGVPEDSLCTVTDVLDKKNLHSTARTVCALVMVLQTS